MKHTKALIRKRTRILRDAGPDKMSLAIFRLILSETAVEIMDAVEWRGGPPFAQEDMKTLANVLIAATYFWFNGGRVRGDAHFNRRVK